MTTFKFKDLSIFTLLFLAILYGISVGEYSLAQRVGT